MRIGEFVTLLHTTKDTVRHYEDLNLIVPTRTNNRKEYSEKEILDFQVIIELKEMGLSLKDIQLLFELKGLLGCGDKKLIDEIVAKLTNHVDSLLLEEENIRNRRIQLQKKLSEIKKLL
ncbi:MerR family transcriptional regulator [Bacillus cereus]|uniref:MerR family transcriptional regulator n=1 Tax=Bacillus cereus TaxID=1396 RepID=UPI003CFD7E08